MHDPVDLMGDPLLFSQENRWNEDSPELRLFAALLQDVYFCLVPGTMVDRATRHDALVWVHGEVDSPAPCSFREICVILGLDETATRGRLLALASGETLVRRRRLDALLRSASAAHGRQPNDFTGP